MESKKCTVCKEEKPISEYSKRKETKSGLRKNCKSCCRKTSKAYYLLHKSEITAYSVNRKRQLMPKMRIDRDASLFLDKKKKCSICFEEKLNSEFDRSVTGKYGTRSMCRNCRKVKYNTTNERQDAIRRAKEYYLKNPDKVTAYRIKNKVKINKRKNEIDRVRYRTDDFFRAKRLLRGRVNLAFKNKKWKKDGSEKLLGCSFETAKAHIERQFKKGMNWMNSGYGQGRWHLDHKIPLSYGKTKEELIALCHYTNLQPLWSIDNLKKGNKIFPIQTTLTI